MTRITRLAALAAALSPLVSAGIEFIAPKAGSDLTAGTSITVQWKEGGSGPKLADLTSYQLFLVAGGNEDGEQFVVKPITTTGLFTAGNTASSLIEATLSEDTKDNNAYFVKMVAVAKAGGELTTYSDRFSYSGFTGKGVLPAPVKSAISSIKGTDGPASKDATGDDAAADAGAAPGAKEFDMDYTMQTGLTRYAPMQPVPPTKITATNTKPLYPTSSVSIATTNLPIPSVQITITATQTFSAKSHENTVSAAPHPTDDMAKFLRRWMD